MLPSVSEQNFSKQILESPLPVLVNFWTPWCGLCLAINPVLSEFQSQWQGRIKFLSINPDENFQLARTYRLSMLPTLMLFHQGQVVQRIDSFQGKEELRRLLAKTLTGLVDHRQHTHYPGLVEPTRVGLTSPLT